MQEVVFCILMSKCSYIKVFLRIGVYERASKYYGKKKTPTNNNERNGMMV